MAPSFPVRMISSTFKDDSYALPNRLIVIRLRVHTSTLLSLLRILHPTAQRLVTILPPRRQQQLRRSPTPGRNDQGGGERHLFPLRATLLGDVCVVPRQLPNTTPRTYDGFGRI